MTDGRTTFVNVESLSRLKMKRLLKTIKLFMFVLAEYWLTLDCTSWNLSVI